MQNIYQTRITYIVRLYLRIPLFMVLLASPLMILSNPIPGFIFTLVCLMGVTATEGICMDFEQKKFKVYFSIFGLKFGSWQLMPVYNRLTVVPVQENVRAETYRSSQSHVYQVNSYMARLYDEGSYDYQVVSKGDKEKVLKEAEMVATLTNIPFEDFTQS